MSDLAAALSEAGHHEVASELERRELAGRLRNAGRDDLADALITGETPPAEQPEPAAAPEPPEHELLAKRLADAQSEWITLGGKEAPDGEAA
jgi:hypothetical protein